MSECENAVEDKEDEKCHLLPRLLFSIFEIR